MRDGEQDSSEYVVHGDELKKVVRLGRRRPMPFAFCPSLADDISLFATHRKRKPEMIARATRRDSGQTKVAFGTFVIIGKTMVLTCTKELPAIAKKLKKHMRSERLPLNIRVLDQLGREIEADIDEEDDGEDIWGPDGDDEDDDVRPDLRRKPGKRARGDRFGARVAQIRPPIMAAGGTRGDRLRDLLSAALQAHEDGHRDKAESLVTRLEEEVRALMNSSDRPQVAMPAPAARGRDREDDEDADEVQDEDEDEEEDDEDEEDDTPRASPTPDPLPARSPRDDPAAALRVARRLAALRRRAEVLEGEAGRRLMAALSVAARALRAGEVEAALGAADRIEPALARVEAQGARGGPARS